MSMLAEHLAAQGAGGRKLLVPYLMGGIPDLPSFPAALAALSPCADALEVGLPYSDPLMDGPVIAAASERALRAGVGPLETVAAAARAHGAPRLAMTYYNPIHRLGELAFCARLAEAGFCGLIVPDLPVEESRSLQASAAAHELAWVPLVSPLSSPRRVAAIAAGATGFVYAVSTLGVTGARASLSERAAVIARRCKGLTDLPVLVGIGVSTPEQAVAAVAEADGVIIGSSVVRLVMQEGAEAASAWLDSVRTALDAAVAG